MQRITSQSSIQAAELINQASKDPETMLVVSSSGNVRHANRLQRIIYGVVDFFNADAAKQRITEARHAVREKLCTELTVLGQSESTHLAPMIDSAVHTMISDHQPETSPTPHSQIHREVDTLNSNSEIKSSFDSQSQIEAKFKTALVHIREITNESASVPLNLLWQVVEEQRTKQMPVNIQAASTIAANTSLWKKSLGISTQDAFRLASNAWKLFEKKQIPPEEGKEILLCSGRLISRHRYDHEDALNYAIDLWVPMKELHVRMDSIESVMKSLDYAIPELRKQPEQLRVSAAIRYLQLQDTKYANLNAIDEIRRSLKDLPLLQQAMPKGCVINQIHQGAHIRGLSKHSFPEPSPTIDDKKKSLTDPEQALTDGANRLMSAEPLGNTSKPVHGVFLPEVFSQFYSHHIEDLVRGNRFELLTGEKVDTKFSQIEEKRRENPKKLSTKGYEEWATERVRWAGSERAVQIISNLESQTLFADVAQFSFLQFTNGHKYKVTASGENNLAQTSFQANRLTGTNFFIDEFILRETHYANATRLWADLTESDNADSVTQKPTQIHIPLIPNPGPATKASANGFSVKRSVGLSLTLPKSSQIPPTCRITEVSEEWDLMVDWDEWMSMRS